MDNSSGITLIDCDYLHPRFAGSYLVEHEGRALFVDNNTTPCVPRLLATLEQKGLAPEDVEFIIITHVHLDHAGGTSALARACPRAKVLAHPRAAPHLIDPTRLITSARQVYGDETYERLYGKIEPIPAERVRAVEDEERIAFGSTELRFLHTRGHANHHICIHLPAKGVIFTGDSFGLCYPDLQSHGLFVFPSTSPTDFHAEEARNSVRRIAESGAREALLTHFGSVRDLQTAAKQLVEAIDASERILQDAVMKAGETKEEIEAFCKDRVFHEMDERLEKAGIPITSEVRDLLRLDLDLNAQGLAHVAKKTREKPPGKSASAPIR